MLRSLLLLLPLLSVARGQLAACLLDNIALTEIPAGEELERNSRNELLRCTPEQGIVQEGQTISIRVQNRNSGIGQDEDFSLATAYDDACEGDFQQFRNAQNSNVTWVPQASCIGVTGVCDVRNVPLAPPTNESVVCVRILCENTINDCDLTAFVAIEESVEQSGNVICSVNRNVDINSLAGFNNYREFSCGGNFFGLGSDDLSDGATLSYSISTTDTGDDQIRVYHANGDSCGNDPDDSDFQEIVASSCSQNDVRSCSQSDLEVASGPDCVIVQCANGDLNPLNRDCNVQVEITWSATGGSGTGRPTVPALFVGLLAIIFTIWS